MNLSVTKNDETFTLKWEYNQGTTVKLSYTDDGGLSWNEITTTTDTTGEYEWDAPAVGTYQFQALGYTPEYEIELQRDTDFQSGEATAVIFNTAPATDTSTIEANCSFMGVVVCNEGYADIYRKGNDSEGVEAYYEDDSGSYYYDDMSGTFSQVDNGGQSYSQTTASYTMQTSNDVFGAYFDTINVVLEKTALSSNQIETFLAATTSLSNVKVTWASDSNTVFQREQKLIDLGTQEQTGAFKNDSVAYGRRKELTVKRINANSRDLRSIKFRVEAVLEGSALDEVAIHYLEILPDGIMFMGGEDA